MSPAHAVELAGRRGEGASLPIGKMGVWWFLASEVVTFGGLIGVYLIYFFGSKGIHEAGAHLSLPLGTVNTLVLLTSSLTMVLAFAAAAGEDERAARRWLSWTVLLGLVFLVVKGFEWSAEIRRGFIPGEGIFWSFYYAMTGLHALHVLGGVVVNSLLLCAAASGGLRTAGPRIEFAGLYWHFVDLVWIFLFPLLYLTG